MRRHLLSEGRGEAQPQRHVEANAEECLFGDRRTGGLERGPAAARDAVECHVNIS